MSGDGHTYRVDPDRQQRMHARLDADMAAAEKHDEHLWIVAAAFRITPETAAGIVAGDPDGAHLDGENLISLSPGCFRCEEPLNSTTFHRRCRGTL